MDGECIVVNVNGKSSAQCHQDIKTTLLLVSHTSDTADQIGSHT